MKNNLYKLSVNQGKLVYTPEHKHSLQTYAIEWLASWRNTYFLKWEKYSLGNKVSLYIDIDSLTPFENFLATASTRDLYFCISYICEMLKTIENTILDQDKILFDTRYIFVREYKHKKVIDKNQEHNNNFSIALVYIPDKNYHTQNFSSGLKNILSTLTNLIIKKDSKKSSKENQQKLMLAIEDNNIENILTLSQLEFQNNKSIDLRRSIDMSKLSQTLEKIDLPKIILIITVGLISSIFLIDKQFGYIRKSTLSVILVFIIMNLILELILLFSPESPFKIIDYSSLKLKRRKEKLIFENQDDNIDTTNNISSSLHPLSQHRIGQLKLIDGATFISGKKSWNIAGTEFLLGTDSRSDLNLPIISSEPIIMRIIQRSGTFFLESLSKDILVKIEHRQINRYQEYEISNYVRFSIDRFHFSLEIK